MNSSERPPTAPSSISSLSELTRSRTATTLLLITAGVFGLSAVLACVGYAVLTPRNLQTTRDLVIASDWMGFVAAAVGLAAVLVVLWQLTLAARWAGVAEFSGAGVATLLIVIGLLVVAANSPDGSVAGDVVSAVGIGGWAVLALVIAARSALREQAGPVIRQADLWLFATGAVTALAIGSGLPVGQSYGRGTAIASGVLRMIGAGVLAGCLVVAMRRRKISGRGLPTLLAGVAILAAGYLVAAVGYGFVFSPSATFTTIRIGVALPAFVGALAYGVLGVAAFQRLAELGSQHVAARAPQQPWGPPPPGPFPGPPPWAYPPQPPPGWGPRPEAPWPSQPGPPTRPQSGPTPPPWNPAGPRPGPPGPAPGPETASQPSSPGSAPGEAQDKSPEQ